MAHKILVVDDDNALREMVGIVLEAEGFEVSYHDAGSGALEAFKSGEPDLVLLDVMLPGKDGIEVCKEIRATAGTPIIMLTAKSSAPSRLVIVTAKPVGLSRARSVLV